jgi:hypothetical protein
VLQRLGRIEAALGELLRARAVKDWHTTDEFAQLVHEAEFTAREWRLLRRSRAEKRGCGRGRFRSWAISHQEPLRYQREGLLALARHT